VAKPHKRLPVLLRRQLTVTRAAFAVNDKPKPWWLFVLHTRKLADPDQAAGLACIATEVFCPWMGGQKRPEEEG
jgi:hypothetical protein